MAYCTQADIVIRFPTAHITQALDDEGTGAEVAARVTQIIVETDAFIDTFLSKQHTTPYTGGDETVKTISIELSYYEILKRRRQGIPDEDLKFLYQKNIDKLKMIANGTIKLAGATSFQNTSGFFKSNKDSSDKIYTEDHNKRFTVYK